MEWKKLSKNQAKQIFMNWANSDRSREYNGATNYEDLNNELLQINEEVKKKMQENHLPKTASYFFDLHFGMKLYMLLEDKYNFKLRHASDDEVWIYISMYVIPQIIEERWGLVETRFFKDSRRIWLKTIWWYIHLSWNESEEVTLEYLKDNTTDEIVQLVERIGPYGYRTEFSRELMKQFYYINKENKNRNLFRQIMKLNTARVKVTEPRDRKSVV